MLQQLQIFKVQWKCLKSKRYDLKDMFNNTFWYLEDLFTIDNPECEKYISDI